MNSTLGTSSNTHTSPIAQQTIYSILFSIAFAHLLNDLLQAVIPASYPILKQNFNLNFTQIGLITLAYQLAASILQPLVGLYTDKGPNLFSNFRNVVYFSWNC
jgi:FSR family fosmidomycin resistance protein-like MFS transporter